MEVSKLIRKNIKVKPLISEDFRPYGQLVRIPQTNPESPDDLYSWWGKEVLLPAEGPISTGILKVKHRDFVITKLERHIKTAEMLIPLKGISILVVGKSSLNDEELEKVDAFYLNSDQIIVIDVGILHWLPFPLEKEAVYAVVFRSETPQDDLRFINIKEKIKLII